MRTDRWWGRIDRYLASEMLAPFLGGLAFFTFVFMMFQALRLAEFFIVHGVSFSMILKLIGLMLISILPFTLSISFLVSVLIALRRLNSDGEWTAMRSCGFGWARLARPLIVLAGCLSIVTLALGMEWAPYGERTIKGTIIKIGNTKIVASLQAGAFTSGFFDLLIYSDKVDTKTNKLSHVFIYDERKPKNPVAVVAKSGEIVQLKTEKELDVAHVLKLNTGNIHRNDRELGNYQKVDFDEYNLFLKINEGENVAANTPKMKGYRQLLHDAALYRNRPDVYAEFQAEFWRRLALAFSPFAFLTVGIGFGLPRNRAGGSSASLIAFGCMIFYLTLESMGSAWVMRMILPAWLGMMIPNASMIVLGLFSASRSK